MPIVPDIDKIMSPGFATSFSAKAKSLSDKYAALMNYPAASWRGIQRKISSLETPKVSQTLPTRTPQSKLMGNSTI